MALSVTPKLGPFFAWNKTNSSHGAIETLDSVTGSSATGSDIAYNSPETDETISSIINGHHTHHRRSSSSLAQSTTELSTFDTDEIKEIPDVDLTQTATRTTNNTLTPTPNTYSPCVNGMNQSGGIHVIKPQSSDYASYEYECKYDNSINDENATPNNQQHKLHTTLTPLLMPTHLNDLTCLLNEDTINHITRKLHVKSKQSKSKSKSRLSTSSIISEGAERKIFNELFDKIGAENEHEFLYQHNYAYYSKLSDCLQGEMFKAEIVNPQKMMNLAAKTKTPQLGTTNEPKQNYKIPKYVTIKKIEKILYKSKISIEDDDGFCTCVDEDILKETKLLKRLTVSKNYKSESKNIIHYVDFFESNQYFYLVFEYVDEWMSLRQFVDRAHIFIQQKKLKLTEYNRMLRYIFWQIVSTLHWLHTDIQCCHLNLCLENIILDNASFNHHVDGTISLNRKLSARLTNFGNCEVFAKDSLTFECYKECEWFLIDGIQYQSPQMVSGNKYDARKQDMWSLGMMMYHAAVGKALYTQISDQWNDEPAADAGYEAAMNGLVMDYVNVQQLKLYLNHNLLSLVHCLLNPRERKRFDSMQVLQSKWFSGYFKRYHSGIKKRSLNSKRTINKNYCRQYL